MYVFVTVASLVVLLSLMAITYFDFVSTANIYENGIVAQYTDNQNVYDNGFKQVLEAAKVTTKQADDLNKLYKEVLSGVKDSGAVLLALGKFNPDMDQNTYRKVQQLIESFRNDFKQRQTELIARKNQYKNFLTGSTKNRAVNQFANYPKIDLATYDIVTSDETQDTFKTKRAKPLDIQ